MNTSRYFAKLYFPAITPNSCCCLLKRDAQKGWCGFLATDFGGTNVDAPLFEPAGKNQIDRSHRLTSRYLIYILPACLTREHLIFVKTLLRAPSFFLFPSASCLKTEISSWAAKVRCSRLILTFDSECHLANERITCTLCPIILGNVTNRQSTPRRHRDSFSPALHSCWLLTVNFTDRPQHRPI